MLTRGPTAHCPVLGGVQAVAPWCVPVNLAPPTKMDVSGVGGGGVTETKGVKEVTTGLCACCSTGLVRLVTSPGLSPQAGEGF